MTVASSSRTGTFAGLSKRRVPPARLPPESEPLADLRHQAGHEATPRAFDRSPIDPRRVHYFDPAAHSVARIARPSFRTLRPPTCSFASDSSDVFDLKAPTESNRRPPPYHALLAATGRNRRQRFSLDFAVFAPERFATGCHRLQPRGSIRLHPSLSFLATFDGATALLPAAAGSVKTLLRRGSS
jgi:hypothetical protein